MMGWVVVSALCHSYVWCLGNAA